MGKEWHLNPDNTISPALCPELCLGLGPAEEAQNRVKELKERNGKITGARSGLVFTGVALMTIFAITKGEDLIVGYPNRDRNCNRNPNPNHER